MNNYTKFEQMEVGGGSAADVIQNDVGPIGPLPASGRE
jgi:hypothetical protein